MTTPKTKRATQMSREIAIILSNQFYCKLATHLDTLREEKQKVGPSTKWKIYAPSALKTRQSLCVAQKLFYSKLIVSVYFYFQYQKCIWLGLRLLKNTLLPIAKHTSPILEAISI